MAWSDMRTIVDGQPEPSERVDCPVCGEVLHSNGTYWSCPRQGADHWYSRELPRA